jgi:hypothetical protein
MAVLGAAGTGVVCGWLAGGVSRPGAKSLGVLLAALAALVAEAFALAGGAAVGAVLAALVAGASARTAWTWWLRRRAQPDLIGDA